MGDFTLPGGLQIPLPRPSDFVIPIMPFLPPSPIIPFTPVPLPDRQTIERALRKGHEVIKDIFDTLSRPPTRYLAEGLAIAGAFTIHPLLGGIVTGTVAMEEAARLASPITHK